MKISLLLAAILTATPVIGGSAQVPQKADNKEPDGLKKDVVAKGTEATDLYGDPLPEGAIARMGSIQFRHAGLSDFVHVDKGKTILSAGSDRVLRFWDATKGKQTRTVKLAGTKGPGIAVTLSPDGKWLAAVDENKIVIWEVDSGKEIKELPGPKGNVGYLYFSPDGNTLAVGKEDRRVSLWDWQKEKERDFPLIFDPRPGAAYGMDSTFHGSFSPDGKWFVAGASSNEPLGVFEVATGREVHRFSCNALTSTVSPDSKRLAVSSGRDDQGRITSVLRFFDLANGKEIAQYPMGFAESFFTLAFAPDGKTLACGFSDKSCLVDCGTGRMLHQLEGRPIGVAFSPDGKTLAGSGAHHLRFWDVAKGKESQVRPGDFGSTLVLAVSQDGKLLAEADWMDQSVSLWDTATGRLLRQLPIKGEQRYTRNLAFSNDGQTLVAGQYHGLFQHWNAADGKELRTAQLTDPQHPNKDYVYYTQLGISADGKTATTLERILNRKEYSRLAYWEMSTGKLLSQTMLDEYVRGGPCSPDGKTIALPLSTGLAIMNAQSGKVRFRVPGVANGSPVAASPDFRLLAAQLRSGVQEGSGEVKDASLSVWETASGKEIASLPMSNVHNIALARDNRSLVTVGQGFLRVWDLATGKERHRWALPEGAKDLNGLVLSPDGKRAFTALGDGTCLVWDLTPALKPVDSLVTKQGENDLKLWWEDLANDKGNQAYVAVWRFIESPEASAAFLQERLRGEKDRDSEKIAGLIKDLDSDNFEVREKATKNLEEAGEAAAPALRQAMEKEPSAELRRRLENLIGQLSDAVTSPRILRRLRVIQVLEHINTKETRKLLSEMARGSEALLETREAKTALERMSKK